ncbi:MAG: tetratricopeptide repeat protein [Bacteroidales bacterium]|nr:tetratricopeptide repeat protein [Bacteroidales bacterium]
MPVNPRKTRGLKPLTIVLGTYIALIVNLNAQTDSLRTVLSRATEDTTRIRLLFAIGNTFIDKGPSDSLIHYYRLALHPIRKNLQDFAKSSGRKPEAVHKTYLGFHFRALMEIGIEESYQGLYDSAEYYYKEALAVSLELGDRGLESEVYGSLGIVYKYQGEYREALEYYEMALQLALEVKDTAWAAACYSNAGNIYRRTANFTLALEYYLKALDIFEIYDEDLRIAICLMNIGNLYEEQNDFDKALDYYHRALHLAEGAGDKMRVAECYMNIGSIHNSRGNYPEARTYYLRSVRLYDTLGYSHELDDCYKYIGNTFKEEGASGQAMDYYLEALSISDQQEDKINQSEILNHLAILSSQTGNFSSAAGYATRSLELARETGYLQNLRDASLTASEALKSLGDYPKALEMFRIYIQACDSLFDAEKYKAITEMEIRYQSEKKEQQLTMLSEKNLLQEEIIRKKNRLMEMLVFGILLMFLVGYVVFRNIRLKERQKAIILEQRMLRSQMNPHFIFNSLIAIQSYIYKKEPLQAGDYLAKFAELIRMILENSRAEFVLLEKELKMLNIYLELQSLRFENRFHYRIEVDPGIETEHIRIPPMLSQPFIENSIEHGFRNKKELGEISIRFFKKNGQLVFETEDNGIGREKSHEFRNEGTHRSMATSITRERLETFSRRSKYKYCLEIVDLKDGRGNPSGTRVRFTLPVRPDN